ncbi:MAG: GNAT family N-acetyltransferase [Pirellulaceae bacterium]
MQNRGGKHRRVGLLLFDGVELLDFAGPAEVFLGANHQLNQTVFEITTVGITKNVVAYGGQQLGVDRLLPESPVADVLVIPGGPGIDTLLDSGPVLDWLRSQAAHAELITSVCSGALLLARCGLLDGLRATTHHRRLEQLQNLSPTSPICSGPRFIDNGKVITAAGIAAGIDMTLHVLARLIAPQLASDVAARMEYPWRSDAADDTSSVNEFGQPIGPILADWQPCSPLPRTTMTGKYCRVESLDPDRHVTELFDALCQSDNMASWTYLPYGPFESLDEFDRWLRTDCVHADPLFHAIIDQATNRAVGMASYLRISPLVGVIEVGHIHFSPQLRRTPAATEAMFLMMSRVFDELGYRRYEWKCDSLNDPSRRAALRLGFSWEGIFRQATIYKGRSRDTAWYSITDREWPRIRRAHQTWLSSDNFAPDGRQLQSLSTLAIGSATVPRNDIAV